jgi:hypothetical protein
MVYVAPLHQGEDNLRDSIPSSPRPIVGLTGNNFCRLILGEFNLACGLSTSSSN